MFGGLLTMETSLCLFRIASILNLVSIELQSDRDVKFVGTIELKLLPYSECRQYQVYISVSFFSSASFMLTHQRLVECFAWRATITLASLIMKNIIIRYTKKMEC